RAAQARRRGRLWIRTDRLRRAWRGIGLRILSPGLSGASRSVPGAARPASVETFFAPPLSARTRGRGEYRFEHGVEGLLLGEALRQGRAQGDAQPLPGFDPYGAQGVGRVDPFGS